MTKNRNPRTKLLIGASLSAILLTGAAQAQSQGGWGRGARGAGADPAAAAARAAQDQAIRQSQTNSQTQRALEAFRRQAQTRTQMQDAQVRARLAAQQAINNVPNGIGQGGLQAAPEIEIDPALWQGANGPTQSAGKDGRTNVTVDQAESKAILTWDSFNVGRETDLTFNQQSADWVVLNRVRDASPSQIHGSVNAKGTVLILNQNGILFGGASTVNVRNLVASSANITNDAFLNNGIYSQLSGSDYLANFKDAGGSITVEAGAQIRTHAPESVTTGGGYVLLLGTTVTNAGSITTPKGQTLLSAGDEFLIRRGYGTQENPYSTTRGNEVRSVIKADSESGTVVNTGVIEAAQGDVTLAGRTIRQDGVALATTSVNQRGTIHLLNSASDAEGSVTLGKDSLTIILPELESKDTALDAQRDALMKASNTANIDRATTATGGFDDRSLLPDRLDQSRVEIVTGGDVVFEGGSQTSAQGGQVAVQANNGRITAEDGARIDVSGVMGVALDMQSNSILVNVQGNELRDSSLNRDNDRLKSQDVWIDVRDLVLLPAGTGGYETDRYYTKGGLLEIGGWIDNTPHTIGEWAAVGGTITLAAKEIVAQRGAVFDISGGSLDYQAGWVNSTRVLGEDGKLYDLRNAPAWMKMVAWGDAYIRKHERWGEQYTQVWSHPLGGARSARRWSDGYSVGRDAGRLILSAPTIVFDSDIATEVINGERQVEARADGVTDGYKHTQNSVAQAGGLVLGQPRQGTGVTTWDMQPEWGSLATDMTFSNQDAPEERTGTAWLNSDRINKMGLGEITVAASSIAVENDLVLADGGKFDLVSEAIDINAGLTARSGSVSLRSSNVDFLDFQGKPQTGSIILREDAFIDTRGLWTNLSQGAPADASRIAHIDGGDVYLRSGEIDLQQGSRIDASAGGWLDIDGHLTGGAGGDISLLSSNALLLGAELASRGFTRGGELTIQSGGVIEIVDTPRFVNNVMTIAAGKAVTNGSLTLGDNVVVEEGDRLPFSYSWDQDVFLNAGEVVPEYISHGDFSSTIVLTENDYNVPDGIYIYDRNWNYYYSGSADHATVPANTEIIYVSIEPGVSLPPEIFPDGVALGTLTLTRGPGEPAPHLVTFDQGMNVPAGTVFNSPTRLLSEAPELTKDFFRQGFSSYKIIGLQGVAVAEGVAVEAVQPVYLTESYADPTRNSAITAAIRGLKTGEDINGAFAFELPPLYTDDAANAVSTQRAGANVNLWSGVFLDQPAPRPGGGLIPSTFIVPEMIGNVTIREGASITVDPGAAIRLLSDYEIAVDGRLTAYGGDIALNISPYAIPTNSNWPVEQSIRIGEEARLDASARAHTATDLRGRLYGTVPDGGSILIGGLGSEPEGNVPQYGSAYAKITVMEGAVLDVSGTSAPIDVLQASSGQVRRVDAASNGGSININSYQEAANIRIGGELVGRAGGDGALGGRLDIIVEAPLDPNNRPQPPAYSGSRSIVIAGALTDEGLLPEDTTITAGQIMDGGFGTLNLTARSSIVFDGNVELSARDSILLSGGQIGNRQEDGVVRIAANYVLMDGRQDGSYNRPDQLETGLAGERLTVEAGLVDFHNGWGGYDQPGSAFQTTEFLSRGDIRMLQSETYIGENRDVRAVAPTSFSVRDNGELILSARQIYPTTNAVGEFRVSAPWGAEGPITARITIKTPGGALPDMPMSVNGTLSLDAPTIDQGGVLRAPLGTIDLNASAYAGETSPTVTVNLLPGSLTSVSGAGMTTLFGGTVDGAVYTVDGLAPLYAHVHTGQVVGGNRQFLGINIGASNLTVAEGAVIDVSGGGTLNGAAFVSGRGGSLDVLTTALVNANPANSFSSADNRVFAIVPGIATPQEARSSKDTWTGDVPEIGRTITIPDGVPGLPAGTYTLLPAYYALLPGGYRVEMGSSGRVESAASELGGGIWRLSGREGMYGVQSALPTDLTIMAGKTVRTYSQYNEQNYESFARSQTALFGQSRPLLPGDGKFLYMNIVEPYFEDILNSLDFKGTVNFAGENGYYQGTASLVGRTIVVTPDAPQSAERNTLYITQQVLDRIAAPNLYLGDRPTSWIEGNPARGEPYRLLPYILMGEGSVSRGSASSITVQTGVTIKAGHLVLYAQGFPASWDGTPAKGGNIVVEQGATLTSLGMGITAPDSSLGFQYHTGGRSNNGESPEGNPLDVGLVVSNGWIDFAPVASDLAISTLTVEDGARLYSDGSLSFVASAGVDLQGETPNVGARYLSFAVPSLNIGVQGALDAAAAEGLLPAGMNLTQSFLDKLLNGDPTSGAPAVESLTLRAANAINFYGSAVIDTYDANGKSRLDELVLNAPALYGAGAAGDEVVFRTERLVWASGSGAPTVSRPGAVLAGGAGEGAGRLRFETAEFVLGYPALSRDSGNSRSDRLALGFASVDIHASKQVSGDRIGTLNIFQSADPDIDLADLGIGYDPKTYAGIGGTLNIVAPLVTAAGGADIAWRAGGAITLSAPDGGPAAPGSGAVGGAISLAADTISVNTTVAAASGLVSLTATQDLVLGEQSRIDVSGRTLTFFDQKRPTWGGEVRLESTRGDIRQEAGGVIDVSSVMGTNKAGEAIRLSDAGRLHLTATGAGAGSILLDGALLAGAGLDADYKGGVVDIRAQRIGTGDLSTDFAAFNMRLNTAGFSEGRAFQIKQGDLVIGSEIAARDVMISIDSGSLTVNGVIDATNVRPGSIRLAARDNLTIGAGAVLDVRGEKLWVDDYGKVIEASNRGHVELASRQGLLTLADGATIDFTSPDGISRGQLELSAARTGTTGGGATGSDGPANATGDNIAIRVGATVNVRGAERIVLNGTARYDNAPPDPENAGGRVIDQAWLDLIDADNLTFVDNLYGGNVAGGTLTAAVRDNLGGLLAYGDALHVRPGVEIVSDGDLRVSGELDLSDYRYGPDADSTPLSPTYGAGEPLRLTLAAAGDTVVKGSISDGFAPTPPIPPRYGGVIEDVSIPASGFVETTAWWTDEQYRYYSSGNLYENVFLIEDWTIPQTDFYQWFSSNNGYRNGENWSERFFPGDTIPAGTLISTAWGGWAFEISDSAIPKMAASLLPGIPAQPASSAGGAPMGAGRLSASIRLVSGADIGAADTRAIQAASLLSGGGDFRLAGPEVLVDGAVKTYVIRTGSGDLDLLSGGTLAWENHYGVYTAGTATATPSGFAATTDGVHFPDHGGDLLAVAQGDLHGYSTFNVQHSNHITTNVDGWLVGSTGDTAANRYWGVRFGDVAGSAFNGLGTLGGGNATIVVGGNAGNLEPVIYVAGTPNPLFSQAITFAVAATGRVTGTGAADLHQTGGGDLNVRIGGQLNPGGGRGETASNFVALRGDLVLDAGSIGTVGLQYGSYLVYDPRQESPWAATTAAGAGGPLLVLGDTQSLLRARGDVVLGNFDDGGSDFKLATDRTSIDLFGASGSATLSFTNSVIPSQLRIVAGGGSIYQGANGSGALGSAGRLILLPSINGQLELLARDSVLSDGQTLLMASFDPNLVIGPQTDGRASGFPFGVGPNVADLFQFTTLGISANTPLAEAIRGGITDLYANSKDPIRIYANSGDIVNLQLGEKVFGQPVSATPSEWDGMWYGAAMPVAIRAGRDIVNLGGVPNSGWSSYRSVHNMLILHNNPTDVSVISAGRDLIYAAIEIGGPGVLDISAGRNFYQGDGGSVGNVGGDPGIYISGNFAQRGAITSVGAVLPGDTRLGASISMAAGMTDVNWDGMRALYLDPANHADPEYPLSHERNTGKVVHTYETELADWLDKRYDDYAGASSGDAMAFFEELPVEQQRIFLRQVYYAELKAGGREYSGKIVSGRTGSYLRGRQAIASLFPDQDATGNEIVRTGAITLYTTDYYSNGFLSPTEIGRVRYTRDAAVRTLFGGDIEMMAPGGQIVTGIQGIVPGAAAGVTTQGSGDIRIFSEGSLLLGLSRIMTTFGGSILGWSEEGDINAGRGAKTTILYTPPLRVYDTYGNVVLSPQVPSSGAGIGTLNPIPEVEPGDIDLIAPLGTIDAGEAGIRVSGDINLAALQVLNAANIKVQGEATGVPVAANVNTGALTAASSTASAVANQAAQLAERARPQVRTEIPVIVQVRLLGFGENP